MRNVFWRGQGACLLLAAAVVVSMATSPGLALEKLWSAAYDSYGSTVRSVKYSAPGVDEEAADDFEVHGTIERIIAHGRNDCSGDCFDPPQPNGVWVRFYEWTASGPGALEYEEFLAAGDPGFAWDELGGAGMLDLTLTQPFTASGQHYVAVQTVFGEPFNWSMGPANDNSPVGSYAVWRDNLAGGAWEQATDYWGSPVSQDYAFDLWGCPAGGCEPPPLVAGCGEWTIVDSPVPPGDERAYLNEVDVLASHDAWAVGSYEGPVEGYHSNRPQALAMHWDGTAWSIVPAPSPAPSPATTSVELHAVSGSGTNDVWAVGRKRDQDEGGHVGERVFALRWDGFEWTDMNAPWPTNQGDPYQAASGEQLYDVVALASDDVWMVGSWWVEQGGGVIDWPGVAMQWDGSGFTPHELPMVSPQDNQLANAVAAVSSTDVWAVGEGHGTGSYSYIWHWDGSSWSHVPGPAPGEVNELRSVVALASDDVWAGGRWRDASWNWYPLLLHWDGSTWTEVSTPGGGDDFAAWAADDILTFGTGGWAHWDGSSWSPDHGPTLIPQGRVIGLGAGGPCRAWAVGDIVEPGQRKPLTVELRPADNPGGDTDGDGVADDVDNCPAEHNPDQADCDADGTGDACELSSGQADDCNGNGTPDNCETFDDCNGNDIPDECEADCNDNGFPDECDISEGSSTDCNFDGVPDECEAFDDCNGNGVNDECDIASGASADGNANGYPDECEALGPGFATVTTPEDRVDFGGAQQMADLPGPDGLVSFREAVIATNNTPGPQTIAFNVPKERWDTTLYDDRVVLRLDDGLFHVTDDETTLDFTTQTDFTGDTNIDGREVAIYGYQANGWGVTAILVSADRCTVVGLDRVMQRGYGIEIAGNDNRVIGTRIFGTLHTAVRIRGNDEQPPRTGNVIGGTEEGEGNRFEGVRIEGPAEDNVVVGNQMYGLQLLAGADRNRVGGPDPGERNTIAGAGSYDGEGCPGGQLVSIQDSHENVIEGNYIGTTTDGLSGYGQIATYGILVRNSNNTILRDNLVADVLVVGQNHCAGDRFGKAIGIEGSSAGTTVVGNRLGLGADAATGIPNREGIVAATWPGEGGPAATQVGGLLAGEGNTIANSELGGVTVGFDVVGVTISGNSIFANGGLGIDLSAGGNGDQAAPVITSATTDDVSLTVEGELTSAPSSLFRVEFFANDVCDPSGAGEGRRFLGTTEVTTDGAGFASFVETLMEPVAAGEIVTATATALATGNTSEFSVCETVVDAACSTPPDQVEGVMVGENGHGNRVSWNASGPGVLHDVARGFVSQIGDTDPTCVAADLAETHWDDAEQPPMGDSFYYLVRGTNECGAGPWSGDGGKTATCD